MEVERILERIGSKKEEVVIDKNFFYCGRIKESDLICLSLLVSREHCLFTKLSDGLYVTDLGSSNGVFINGIQIRPKKQIFLKENDYIGIGCADMVNLDESMFVYKVKNRVISFKNSANTHSTSNVEECSRLSRKEQSKSRKLDDKKMLTKVSKANAEHKLIIADPYWVLNNDNDNEDDDIKIIESTDVTNLLQFKSEQPYVETEIVTSVSAINLDEKNEKIPDKSIEIIETCYISNNINKNEKKSNLSQISQIKKSETVYLKEVQVPKTNKSNNEKMEIDIISQLHQFIKETNEIVMDNDTKIDNNVIPCVNFKEELQNVAKNDFTIKKEPKWGCFSQIDLVEINDDDGSMFPFSQLFDKTVVKEESEELDDGVQHPSLFLDDDDENVITILDSDDENACETNKILSIGPKIKDEQEFGCTDMTMDSIPVLKNDNVSPNEINMPDNEIQFNDEPMHSTANIEQVTEVLNDQESSILQSQALPSVLCNRDDLISTKDRKKGLEIIEPHFMKPKSKTQKKENKRIKNKEVSGNKAFDKKNKYSLDSTSKKISQHYKSTNLGGKCKITNCDNSFSTIPRQHKDIRHKEEKNENHKKNDSNLVENESFNSETKKQILPKHKSTKVKVKISTKTRGDMLYDSMQTLKPKINIKKIAPKAETSKRFTKPSQLCSSIIPRRQTSESSVPIVNSVPNDYELNNLPSTSYNKHTTSILLNATNHINFSSNIFNTKNSLSTTTQITMKDYNIPSKSCSLKSSLIPSLPKINKKKVSFKENISSIREYGIEEGNKLRNIKDGLSIRSTKKDFMVNKSMELIIEDFLVHVFAWEPVWLEQQQTVKTLPPIVKQEDMHELPNRFNSFEEYYKKMEVLLLLETWQQLLKEYECSGNRYNSSIVLPCKLLRHSVRQMQTPNGFRYSMLLINILVSKNQLQSQNHPVYGDMIILEYVIKQGTIQKMRRAFAYVVQVQQQNSLKFLKSNEQLRKYVTSPNALLTYTVQTRIIDEHTIQFDQIARLRSILYIRSHLRLIQGLQFVPHSLLQDSILNVDINDFQLESVTKQQISNYQLITKEKLNEKQIEAVIKFTNASVKLEPKIGLLIGPPGTGKSKVIANLVTQILYGDGRYVGRQPLRILVCAPSNAAIDEIVLRLLDIRGAIKEHRFKMVRIGRIESMHEDVKKISVTELAKREAHKIFFDQHQKNSENIEYKKNKLKNDISSLELLLAGNPYNKIYKKNLENYQAKYKRLTNTNPETEAIELSKLQNSAKMLILRKANVIACTLSSCYTSQMEIIFGGHSDKIATCIVDEATQCCEAEILIPLLLGVKNLILVGDPNQLPATVISTEAKKLGLDKSLFTRIKTTIESQYKTSTSIYNDPIIMLNVQYRMVNAISHWPNNYFYGGKLIDAVNYKQNFPFQPYRVLSLDGVQDDVRFSNTSEALFVGNLINCLMTYGKLSTWGKKITLGVITPYQNQKSLILSTIKDQTKKIPDNIKNKFIAEVNTIDSFQGQERDIIIMSCVRSNGIGFLSDQQRLCVALTRAKSTLIICGNFSTFQRDNTWKNLLRNARSRGVVSCLNTTAKPHDIKCHVIRLD